MKAFLYKITSVILLAVIAFSATPKIYLHSLSGHDDERVHEACHHESTRFETEKKTCSFQKLDTPVQYTLVNVGKEFSPKTFIQSNTIFFYRFTYQSKNYSSISSRGPPCG